MSSANRISRGDSERTEPAAEQAASAVLLPEGLAERYRVVEVGLAGKLSIGLYAGGAALQPAIEFDGRTLKATAEDKQTIKDLVAIASHQGWSTLHVAGTDAFRQATWAEAAEQGMLVKGYEPSFAEKARVQSAHDSSDRAAETASPPPPPSPSEASAPVRAPAARERSDDLAASLAELDTGSNRSARDQAGIERIVQSASRELSQIKDPRTARLAEQMTALVDDLDERRKALDADREPGRSPPGPDRTAGGVMPRQARELADKFLTASAEIIAADPLLANAARAQAAMERNIEVLLGRDVPAIAAANLESRELIADVLARGLDVSVTRHPPMRALEPERAGEPER
jgi:hypothetical protein